MPATLQRRPITEPMLRRDLPAAGVEPGTTLVVHSSLSAIGWVLGGAPAVVRSPYRGRRDGTLAMPAATPQCADPATWRDPRIPEAWIDEAREHLPPFDVRTTPTSIGAIPETFRNWPGTIRSEHPLESVCARGSRAAAITRDHPIAFSEGGSPFARLYDLDSRILLLGVGFNPARRCIFAESLVAKRRTMTVRFPRLAAAAREWVEVDNVGNDDDTHFGGWGAVSLRRQAAEATVGGRRRSASGCVIWWTSRDYFERVL
jgi:aminoglycoside 3-N-acetyltransferase